MGIDIKKKLKKVAKGAALVGTVFGLSKLGKKKPQDVAKKYIGQTINTGKLQTGDARTAANIANWDRGMKRIADAGGVANLRKGGLVKSGKPKLAKKGWK